MCRRLHSRRDPGIATTPSVRVRNEEQTSGQPGRVVFAKRRVRRNAEAHVVPIRFRAGAVGAATDRGPDGGLRRARTAAQGTVEQAEAHVREGDQKRSGRVVRGRQTDVGGGTENSGREPGELGRGIVAARRGDHQDHQSHGQTDQGRPFDVPADRPVHVVGGEQPGGRDVDAGQDEIVVKRIRANEHAA